MMIEENRLFDVVETTWPAASTKAVGPWLIRDGKGGGKRVSAITAVEAVTEDDIASAVVGTSEFRQSPIFMIRPGEDDLDALLEQAGYQIVDPVVIYECPIAKLTDLEIPRVTMFPIWEPLKIMEEIWRGGGIGPERVEVMRRVTTPKTALLARRNDQPAGTAFCALHEDIAMVHAVEVLPEHRRSGMGAWMMRGAAVWAQENGATTTTVLCTRANVAACGLYESLGMTDVGGYHYRYLPT